MNEPLPAGSRERLFDAARTAHVFLKRPVHDATLHALYEMYKWGPTSMNCQPSRVLFVKSLDGKKRMLPALYPGNVEKTMSAPVTAIVAFDTQFFEFLPQQFPPNPRARDMFSNDLALSFDTGMRNGTLQGAYLMIAARSLGLDVGPMSGFDAAAINAEFFRDGRWRVNFLINLGWADRTAFRPRGPRLAFDEAARIL